MKKIMKSVAIITAILMLCGILAGCGKNNATVVKTGGSYTYWASLPTASSETIKSFNEMLMYQEMEKRTGTKIEFMHPAQGTTGSEAFQILLASGDLPDMIEYNWGDYTGGPDQAITDGVLISLNDYLEDYAPNYYDLMEGKKAKENDYSYKVDSISQGGNYYGFKQLNVGAYAGYGGLYVRKDMLAQWGLDIPETIDDWSDLFKVAKEKGIKYPLTGSSGIFAVFSSPSFNSAWNVGKGFYVDDNRKVKFGPFESQYVEYLEKMNEWYKLGYIDVDYVTNDNTAVEGAMTNGSSVASFGYVGGGLGKLLPAMAERDPNYDLAACPYPVMKKGDIPLFQEVADTASDPCIGVSYQCGKDDENRYKEAISWCDYLYGEEGMILQSFGIEGQTFEIQKDNEGEEHFVYTDAINDHEKIGAHSISAALYHFMRPANGPGFAQHPDYLNGYYPYEQQKDAIEVWNLHKDIAREHTLPGCLSYTEEEAVEIANIDFTYKNDISAAVSNRIIGKIDTEEFISEMERIKEAGYNKATAIHQAAYDRYMKVKTGK